MGERMQQQQEGVARSFGALVGTLRSVRPRHLGFAFFWLWMSMFMHGPQIVGWTERASAIATGAFSFLPLLALTLFSAVTMLAVALFAGSRSLVGSRAVCVAAVALTVVGTVARALSGGASFAGWEAGPLAVSTAAAGIAGIGTALTMVGWGEYYGCVGARRASAYIVLSVLFSHALCLAMNALPPLAQMVAMCACPALSVGLLIRNRAEVRELFPVNDAGASGRSERSGRFSRLHQPLPGKLAACSVACGVIAGMVNGTSVLMGSQGSLEAGGFVGPLTGAVVALLFLAGLACFGASLDRGFTYRPTLLVMVAGCALLPFAGVGRGVQVGSAIVGGGYLLFYMLTWITYADSAHRLRIPGAPVFAWGRLFAAIGYGAGMLAGGLCLRVLGPDVFTPAIVSYITMGALVCTAVFVLDEKDVAAGWGRLGAAEAGHAAETPGARLADACGLTKRESEVLDYLLKGRSVARIAEDLGLSYNTVNSHVANIYAKCGVHSRQELIDRAEKPGA